MLGERTTSPQKSFPTSYLPSPARSRPYLQKFPIHLLHSLTSPNSPYPHLLLLLWTGPFVASVIQLYETCAFIQLDNQRDDGPRGDGAPSDSRPRGMAETALSHGRCWRRGADVAYLGEAEATVRRPAKTTKGKKMTRASPFALRARGGGAPLGQRNCCNLLCSPRTSDSEASAAGDENGRRRDKGRCRRIGNTEIAAADHSSSSGGDTGPGLPIRGRSVGIPEIPIYPGTDVSERSLSDTEREGEGRRLVRDCERRRSAESSLLQRRRPEHRHGKSPIDCPSVHSYNKKTVHEEVLKGNDLGTREKGPRAQDRILWNSGVGFSYPGAHLGIRISRRTSEFYTALVDQLSMYSCDCAS
uniref:Uncharacterized protein n=1 Tax=Steinernema glaseri TaxID=37863 RepID=A0A1I7Z8I8_9BILA